MEHWNPTNCFGIVRFIFLWFLAAFLCLSCFFGAADLVIMLDLFIAAASVDIVLLIMAIDGKVTIIPAAFYIILKIFVVISVSPTHY